MNDKIDQNIISTYLNQFFGAQAYIQDGDLPRKTVLGKPQKTVFFSGPATKALPPPLELSGHKIISLIFLELQNTVFFHSGQALTM